ncbi:GNAT family N-acetyltransferase [Holzapfeliella sp. JNUCC 80]
MGVVFLYQGGTFILIFKDVTSQNSSIQEKVKQLYLDAFPEHERLDFSFIVERAKLNQNHFLAILDDEAFVGLIYYTVDNHNLLVSYLAMDPSTRSKGYGSKILTHLKSQHPKENIFLEIEEVVEEADNYKQRIKRQSFYEKNGFAKSNIYMKTDIEGNGLEIMTTSPIVFDDYKDTITAYLGVENMSEWTSYFKAIIK